MTAPFATPTVSVYANVLYESAQRGVELLKMIENSPQMEQSWRNKIRASPQIYDKVSHAIGKSYLLATGAADLPLRVEKSLAKRDDLLQAAELLLNHFVPIARQMAREGGQEEACYVVYLEQMQEYVGLQFDPSLICAITPESQQRSAPKIFPVALCTFMKAIFSTPMYSSVAAATTVVFPDDENTTSAGVRAACERAGRRHGKTL